MKPYKGILITIVVIFVLLFLLGPYFIVEEGEQAIVIRFGKMIRTETETGLKIRMPLVDQVRYYPKKIQSLDGDAKLYPTKENRYIRVDITARWKIQDPRLFYERIGDMASAHMSLDEEISAIARSVIAAHSLREVVRNSNLINEIKRKDVSPNYEPIKKGRVKLSAEMLKAAATITREYGITLIDVGIRQITFSHAITRKAYQQMIKAD
ncbi:MAG: protease modulator HflC [Candidatus Aminicenantes bacterium]|nr:protease modulator HflC [Candidatus Aminicenantes bacterium]NIM81083.1 protease modulator HflC [Candidatus Aminicenantes bacterium]NIN20460.1 protease modulator HflC [Candidatus Aminicenantes bacterium]NIN44233.1 protease modulator HflC [Candidatus Aminicenantes bacterium]NIN87052.1 protease modulator HflC [Candidatus Aminicenantes bacterium]